MMKQYQVTIFCVSGKYKPVSCIVRMDTTLREEQGNKEFVNRLRTKGITTICNKRGWSGADLERYGYLKIKLREYDKEKIAKQNAERYEKIKAERGWA